MPSYVKTNFDIFPLVFSLSEDYAFEEHVFHLC